MILSKPINVAQVPKRSIFRYPGGKTWLIPVIRQWLSFEKPQVLIEPFAGSGIASLTAVAEKHSKKAVMVELDPDVASVWKTILNKAQADWLVKQIQFFDFTHENVCSVLGAKTTSTRQQAFRTIIWNRATRGGIMAPGSGFIKNGENGKGISSRWYPNTLAKRIEEITLLSNRIDFMEGDGFRVIEKYLDNSNAALFIDPPYTVAGRRLYKFNEIDHENLFSLTAEHKGSFLLTYDDSEEIRKLAVRYNFKWKRITMQNTHLRRKYELIISRDFEWLKENL